MQLLEEQEYEPADATAGYQRARGPDPSQPILPTWNQVIAVLGAIAAVVGQRVALILALGAATLLALRVIDTPAPNAVWVFGLFSVFIFVPVVVLSARRAT